MDFYIPEEFFLPPNIPVYLTGLDIVYNANHKAIWEYFMHRKQNQLAINFKICALDHRLPTPHAQRNSFEWYIPKGMLKRNWLIKHLEIIPSLIVFFYELDWNDVSWDEKKMECNTRFNIIKETLNNRFVKLVVVLIQSNSHFPPGEENLMSQRASEFCDLLNISSKNLFILPFSDLFYGYTLKLENAFFEIAQTYYNDKIKNIKIHISALDKSVHQGLLVRYHFKIGFFNELKQEPALAIKSYIQAYEALSDVKIAETTIHEIKIISALINFKICKILLDKNMIKDALTAFNKHIEQYSVLKENTDLDFENSFWLYYQFEVFAKLYKTMSKQGMRSMETVYHPGHYFMQAGQQAKLIQQWQDEHKNLLASNVLYPQTMDFLFGIDKMEFYGQRPWRPGNLNAEHIDMQREKSGTLALQLNVLKFDMTSIIIQNLNEAITIFNEFHSQHLIRLLKYQLAEQYFRVGDLSNCINLLCSILESLKHSTWNKIYVLLIEMLYKCAILSINLPLFIRCSFELLGLVDANAKHVKLTLIYTYLTNVLCGSPPNFDFSEIGILSSENTPINAQWKSLMESYKNAMSQTNNQSCPLVPQPNPICIPMDELSDQCQNFKLSIHVSQMAYNDFDIACEFSFKDQMTLDFYPNALIQMIGKLIINYEIDFVKLQAENHTSLSTVLRNISTRLSSDHKCVNNLKGHWEYIFNREEQIELIALNGLHIWKILSSQNAISELHTINNAINLLGILKITGLKIIVKDEVMTKHVNALKYLPLTLTWNLSDIGSVLAKNYPIQYCNLVNNELNHSSNKMLLFLPFNFKPADSNNLFPFGHDFTLNISSNSENLTNKTPNVLVDEENDWSLKIMPTENLVLEQHVTNIQIKIECFPINRYTDKNLNVFPEFISSDYHSTLEPVENTSSCSSSYTADFASLTEMPKQLCFKIRMKMEHPYQIMYVMNDDADCNTDWTVKQYKFLVRLSYDKLNANNPINVPYMWESQIDGFNLVKQFKLTFQQQTFTSHLTPQTIPMKESSLQKQIHINHWPAIFIVNLYNNTVCYDKFEANNKYLSIAINSINFIGNNNNNQSISTEIYPACFHPNVLNPGEMFTFILILNKFDSTEKVNVRNFGYVQIGWQIKVNRETNDNDNKNNGKQFLTNAYFDLKCEIIDDSLTNRSTVEVDILINNTFQLGNKTFEQTIEPDTRPKKENNDTFTSYDNKKIVKPSWFRIHDMINITYRLYNTSLIEHVICQISMSEQPTLIFAGCKGIINNNSVEESQTSDIKSNSFVIRPGRYVDYTYNFLPLTLGKLQIPKPDIFCHYGNEITPLENSDKNGKLNANIIYKNHIPVIYIYPGNDM